MNLTITPGHPLRGEVKLPGDKSMSHRAALFAALAEGTSVIDDFLVSGVTRPLLTALAALGVSYTLDQNRLTVEGKGWQGWKTPAEAIHCGNSATTLRLLAGALAASGIACILDGSAGLRNRPMGRILEPLRRMGVQVDAATEGCTPLSLSARPAGQRLNGIAYTLPVASAQVKSCLLLAALAADGPVTLTEPGPSRDHTERMMASMGVEIIQKGLSVTLIPPSQPLHPIRFTPPGDFSSAAFLIVAALITPGSEIIIREVGLNPTRTGLLDALLSMSAAIEVSNMSDRAGEKTGDLTVRFSALRGTKVCGDLVVRMIDEFPAFAIAASAAAGQTDVRDALELRYKESDRITALCQELSGLGVNVAEVEDGFSITGGKALVGGTAQPHGDHRLAMSLALLGLSAHGPVSIQRAEILAESFPEFTQALSALGADLRLEETP